MRTPEQLLSAIKEKGIEVDIALAELNGLLVRGDCEESGAAPV